MTKWLSILLHSFLSPFRIRRNLAFENLLLRQQLAVLLEDGFLQFTNPASWLNS